MASAADSRVCVPIRIDAAWSDHTTHISPPTTRFSDLPDSSDPTEPWLGQTAHTDLNNETKLAAGPHLHWTLPKALRRGRTVYVLDFQLFNELVQQGVPCALVDALRKAAGINATTTSKEYTLDQLNALLTGLAAAQQTPLSSASDFDLSSQDTSYTGLTSTDSNISVKTYMPAFKWDAVFLEIYGSMVVHAAARMKLPPVPNRWLVVRTDTATENTTAWVVESDRLSKPNSDGSAPAGCGPAAIPGEFDATFVSAQTPVKADDTHRWLGLKTSAAQWSEDTTAKRLAPLTAAGHGVPDFAAFYPNCQGVFGFHDGSADDSATYVYDIIGWFADPADDPVSATYAVTPWSAQTSVADRVVALGWSLTNPDWSTIDGSLYAASISVSKSDCGLQAAKSLSNVGVAIGNTAGQALSAYIARNQTDSPTLGISPEAVLNATQAGVLQAALEPDGPAVIENALHGQAFQPVPSGWIWRVTAPEPPAAGLAGTTPTDTQITLTTAVADALNALNVAQLAFDRALATLQHQRHLVFADWCRASHLGTDAASKGQPPNVIFPNGGTKANPSAQDQDLMYVAGYAVAGAASSIRTASVGGSTSTEMLPYLALTDLYLAHYKAQTALAAMPGDHGYLLARGPAPRYWRPNDPQIMMVDSDGDSLTSYPASALPHSEIHDRSYLTLTAVAPGDSTPSYLPTGWDTDAAVPSAKLVNATVDLLTATNSVQSWRPLSLLWEAEFQHFPGVGSIKPNSHDKGPFSVSDYGTDFISSNFTLDASGIDFVAKSGVSASDASPAFYRGRVTLSGHAAETMRTRILQLTGQAEHPPTHSKGLTLPGVLATGTTKTLIDHAYDNDARTLSQTLNGFNDRLLMLERLPQISVFDPGYTGVWNMGSVPTWDSGSQSFYDEIGQQSRTSPNQNDIYNPIRAGKCEITTLTLVDAFGQMRTWSYSPQPLNTWISEALPNKTGTHTGDAPAFLLAPRFAQASRLLFRWIAADGSDDVESNQSPATSPICGWVALNRVNENVMVFTRDGTLIGWIPDGGGDMVYLPGKSASDITDPYLSQVVAQAEAASSTFYADIDTALLTIEPRSHRQHASRSVLESRPLALARASMLLELSGGPSPHQGYEALATMTLGGNDDNTPATGPSPSPYLVREDCGFSDVTFPVNLGDVSMADDGLVLYWGLTGGTIASSYTLVGSPEETGTGKEPSIPLVSAPGTAPVQTLLLLDPRASVHVTSAILPVKEITIPPAMYADALRNMEYLMQVGPLLTPSGSVTMPLPSEIRGTWSWLYEETSSTWSSPVTPTRADAKTHQHAEPAVLRSGFLKAGADDA